MPNLATVIRALLLFGCVLQTPHTQAREAAAAPRNVDEALAAAGTALAADDHGEVSRLLRTALDHAPDHGAAMYYLARAEAQLGRTDAALSLLERLAAQGAPRNLAADPAFAPLAADPRFVELAKRLPLNAAPLVRSEPAQVLQDPGFMPEGLAQDPRSGRFFAGSMNGRGIVQWLPEQPASEFVAPVEGHAVLGLRVDAARGWLWAATLQLDTDAPAHARGRGGWAVLEAFDLASGESRARHPAPDDDRPHLFNDITLGKDGEVFVTDSEAKAVYRLRSDIDALVPLFVGERGFSYPNGIATNPDGALYVAHGEGISRIDPSAPSPALIRLIAAAGIPTGGIDGLYACGRNLLGVQALFGFQQLTLFELDATGTTVLAAHALERRHPSHDSATTGAITGDSFHYIANAQLRRLDADWNVVDQGATPAMILRLPLPQGCG